MRVIVTDANSRKSFDVINILKRVYNLDLLLFSQYDYRFQLPLIYNQDVYPLSYNSYESFKEDLIHGLRQYQNEKIIYLPLSEEPTLLLYRLFDELELPNLFYLLPDQKIFELAREKHLFQMFCEKHQFPVPVSFNEEDLNGLRENFRPVIAKKKVGAGSVGLKYIESVDEVDLLQEIDHSDYLIQEKIISNRKIHGGFFLCRDGVVYGYYGHKRLRTFPEQGGVTVYSKSDFNEEIRQIGAALLEKLNWSGLAMIEFMYDENEKKWKIIELNPRLWGSIMLSEYCESEMLMNYVRLCSNGEAVITKPKTDRYIRWIFPFEVIGLLKGKVDLSDFFNRRREKTCYINFTYSSPISAFFFLLYFTFNIRSIKRFFKKLFS